jgi:hypothetical protein
VVKRERDRVQKLVFLCTENNIETERELNGCGNPEIQKYNGREMRELHSFQEEEEVVQGERERERRRALQRSH